MSSTQIFRKAYSSAKLTSGFPRFGSWNGSLLPPTPRYDFFPSLSSLKAPRQIIQIILGHCSLNAVLYKIRKTSSPRCRFCLNSNVTVDHFIFWCPFFDQDRKIFKHSSLKITKSWSPTLILIPQSAPLWKSFVHFIISSRSLSYSCVSQMSWHLRYA